MPNPNWVPVIGSNFDAIAGQQAGWANFNRGVEEGNFARQAQAQQAQNAWAAHLAGIQEQEASRGDAVQARQDEMAMRDRDRTQAFAERQREFGVSSDLTRDAHKIEAARYEFGRKARDAETQKAMDVIADTAKNLAPEVHDVGMRRESARQQYEAAAAKLATAQADAARSLKPGDAVWKGHQFVSVKATPTEDTAKRIADANETIAQAQAEHGTAAQVLNQYENAFGEMQKRAAANNLLIGKKGNTWIVHSPYNKTDYPGVEPEPKWHPPMMMPGQYWTGNRLPGFIPVLGGDSNFPPTYGPPAPVAPTAPAPVSAGVTKKWIQGPDGKLIQVPVQ